MVLVDLTKINRLPLPRPCSMPNVTKIKRHVPQLRMNDVDMRESDHVIVASDSDITATRK